MKVYGPYKRKDGRSHVVLVDEEKRLKTVSYPKYLMELELGRLLDPKTETIDHKDCDFTNNDFNNLRIIPARQHAKEDALRVRTTVEMECVWCGMPVPQERLKGRHRNKSKGKAGPFCSRSCCGQYGASIQGGYSGQLPSLEVPIERGRFNKST